MSHRSSLLFISCLTGMGLSLALHPLLWVEPVTARMSSPSFQLSAKPDPYQEAIALALQAEAGGKTAKTPSQWADLADQWQKASELMAQVPTTDQRYTLAQAKTETYRNNSDIASQAEDKSRQQSQNAPLLSTLNVGDTGKQVKDLQQALKELGYFKATPDGIFTEATADAVAAFQKAQGLDADGIVGETTWNRLQSAYQAKTSSQASSEKKPASKPKSGISKREIIRWALIGLILITTTAGVALLLLKLLNRPPEDDEESDEELSEVPLEMPLEASSQLDLEPGGNGHVPSLFTESEEPRTESKSPEPNPSKEIEPKPPSDPSSEALTTRLPKINIVDELIHELDSPDPQKRRKAIWELGERGNSQAAQPLINLLINSDSQQRSLILAALTEIGIRTLKPMNRALSISLQDNNPEVRKNAIRDLTRMYELIAHVNQLMRYAAEDPDKEVRETAQWALNQLGRIRNVSHSDTASSWQNLHKSADSSPED